MDFWSRQPFDLQLQQHEGNCDLCFLKGAGKILQILRDDPSRADWWIEQEEAIAKGDGSGAGRFRSDRPGYAELKMIAQGGERLPLWDDHDTIPCTCTN